LLFTTFGGRLALSSWRPAEAMQRDGGMAMLWTVSSLNGDVVAASDGRIGAIVGFLFEDTNWHIRWAVVKTGAWLLGRKALIPVAVLRHPGAEGHEFPVALTMQQVRESPGLDTDRPVSRQMETCIFDHYGWRPCWGDGLVFGAYGFGDVIPASPFPEPTAEEREMLDAQRSRDDPHLRSTTAVTGYHVNASDGQIGHIDDFLIEDTDWTIRSLVVETKTRWAGHKVLISTELVKDFDWHDRRVDIDAERRLIEASPEYDPSVPLDGACQERIGDRTTAPGRPPNPGLGGAPELRHG
jgi:hypothetical protein